MASNDGNPWQLAQQRLQEVLDEHSYESWFKSTRFESYDDGSLVVGVPSQFFADRLQDRYEEIIYQCVREFASDVREVRFQISDDIPLPTQTAKKTRGGGKKGAKPPRGSGRYAQFNPRYVFERFVVGGGNRFAQAAARAVAEAPGNSYNPLFLYGGVGLGKTHLMQAIGQEILARTPQLNVVYLSSECFTNQLIESIATQSPSKFRSKYRKVDVLLIDDIHFIGGKEATMEEFFHTFNALFDRNKQIIFSSDRQPKEIRGLEERLLSRFEWGLVTDIQPPDLETREAILQNKASEENHAVPPEVLRYIATHVTTNIRELEGALITVVAYSKLTEQTIDLRLAQEVLRDLIGRDKIRPITMEAIQRVVAEYFDVRISDLRGRSRQRQISFPRQIAMFLARTLIPSLSLNEIGEAFGGKDHATVVHSCKKITREVKERTETRQLIEHLGRLVRS